MNKLLIERKKNFEPIFSFYIFNKSILQLSINEHIESWENYRTLSNIFINTFEIAKTESEYFKIFVIFIIILFISLLLFSLAYFLSSNTIRDNEKLSQYECGFEPFDEATRHPFDIHFYVVGILFLIFDVEIALLFPWVLGLSKITWFNFYSMLIFLSILTIGFFYEWHRGALVWPHKQVLNEN